MSTMIFSSMLPNSVFKCIFWPHYTVKDDLKKKKEKKNSMLQNKLSHFLYSGPQLKNAVPKQFSPQEGNQYQREEKRHTDKQSFNLLNAKYV